jgi:chromosome segregation ATPase
MAAEKAGAESSRAAGLRGRLEALQARLADDESRGISRAARRVGGRPLSDGLEVEAGFRVAVEAALGETMRGYVVGHEAALGLDGQRGVLVLEAAIENGRRPAAGSRDRAAETTDAVVAAAAGQGGGKLVDAVRVDPVGAASRLLARTVWVPDLNGALAVQAKLPAGWVVVTRDGAVVTSSGVVSMGRAESLLERRAEVERLAEEVARLETESAAAASESAAATKAAAAARATLEAARETERRAGSARREAEEGERRAARALSRASPRPVPWCLHGPTWWPS